MIGGHYTNHHGNGPKSTIESAKGATDHPILRGVEVDKLIGNGSLYVVQPLVETAQPLLIGSIFAKEPEPVAWTNLAGPKKARVFNTTLGHWEDFENPAFCKLLNNGLFWALAEAYPAGEDIDKLLPAAVK